MTEQESSLLQEGEVVLIIDRKGRRYLQTLASEGEFHTHAGVTPHAMIINQPDGCTIRTDTNAAYVVLRPTMSDYVVKMKRGAQVIYPKDIAAILMMADIHPGVHVLEAGVGSAALSIAMLRAGARITGYEVRDDFAKVAERNVRDFLGQEGSDRFNVQVRDIYEGIDETGYDRIVLDLPEPWNVIKHAEGALRSGGIILCYSPSITQVARTREVLEESRFGLLHTSEVMERGWYIEGQAVRPDHRMVAHTGFLTTARLLQEQFSPPKEKMRDVRA